MMAATNDSGRSQLRMPTRILLIEDVVALFLSKGPE
jgi:hypothetical protein